MSEPRFLFPKGADGAYPQLDEPAKRIVETLKRLDPAALPVHVQMAGDPEERYEYVRTIDWPKGEVWLGFGRPQGMLEGDVPNNAGLRHICFRGPVARQWTRHSPLLRLALYPDMTMGPALTALVRGHRWHMEAFLEGRLRSKCIRYAGFCTCPADDTMHRPHGKLATRLFRDSRKNYLDGNVDEGKKYAPFLTARPGDPWDIRTSVLFDVAAAAMARLLRHIEANGS